MMRRLLFATLCMLMLASCGVYTRRVDIRFHANFPRRPEGTEITLWLNETDRPKVPIAVISSHRTAERSRAAREEQIEELRQRAWRMGADAIENVRLETSEVNGFVADPYVPFTAFKQGEFQLYFVRGTAVRYLDSSAPPEAMPPAMAAEGTLAPETLDEPASPEV